MSKVTFLSVFSLIFLVLFVFLDVPILLRLSFFANFLSLWVMTYYNIFIEKKFAPFLGVFVVFNLLFLIVAPLVQISHIISNGDHETGKYIQNLPYNEFFAIRANLYILLFNVVFFTTYIYFKNKKLPIKTNLKVSYTNTPLVLLVLGIISFLILAFNFSTLLFQYQNDFYKEVEQTTLSNYLIVQKFLFFVPISGLFLAHYYLRNSQNKMKNYLVVVFFLFLFLFFVVVLKNPLTEKRNALGPIYITLIYLFYRKGLNTNYKVVRFMFFIMVVLFPLVSIVTHSQHSLREMVSKPSILADNMKMLDVAQAFNSLHYDAYPDYLATIDYCDRNGITYGEQLKPVFLFFVPRSVWIEKPEVTGFKIGNYLIDAYGFNFNNLSNPYVSEGYINFGVVGIILFAFILALIFIWQTRWLNGDDYLKSIFAFYFAIYLIYFLRGDLANVYMLIISAFFAVVVFPKILYVLINYYVKK
jgi:O-antigen polysaccharide polymerase Wzy